MAAPIAARHPRPRCRLGARRRPARERSAARRAHAAPLLLLQPREPRRSGRVPRTAPGRSRRSRRRARRSHGTPRPHRAARVPRLQVRASRSSADRRSRRSATPWSGSGGRPLRGRRRRDGRSRRRLRQRLAPRRRSPPPRERARGFAARRRGVGSSDRHRRPARPGSARRARGAAARRAARVRRGRRVRYRRRPRGIPVRAPGSHRLRRLRCGLPRSWRGWRGRGRRRFAARC